MWSANKIEHQNHEKKLLSSAENKVGLSTRTLARKFPVSNVIVQRISEKNNAIYGKRQREPKFTQQQLEKIPKFCRALRREYFSNGRYIILNDEWFERWFLYC